MTQKPHSSFDLREAQRRDRSQMTRGDMSLAMDVAYTEIKNLYEQYEEQKRLYEQENLAACDLSAKVAELVEQLEVLRNALIGMRELASVSYDGDPWYAENDGLNAADVFDRAREALGESSPASGPKEEA